ncbi:MAG: adenylate/guanylate cyclase domain-containing protein, partial [Verrucomicrobiota bacterium]
VISFAPAVSGTELSDRKRLHLQRRLVNLPWLGSILPFIGWGLCIPVFLGSLAMVPGELDVQLFWHLPISFLVSGFISLTHSFFIIELASHQVLYPVLFKDSRPDQVPGTFSLNLTGRGLAWAVSAGICPIGSLILLAFAPQQPGSEPAWFVAFVGSVGIAFGLCTAMMMSRLVAKPIDLLRKAAQEVASGNLDVKVNLLRADEFGLLVQEFNRMVAELREKEKVQQTFGLHVGKRTAERLLKLNPGLSGSEEVITVMFVDIRNFTARSSNAAPEVIVQMLNTFFGEMVTVIEEEHGGMINKFLGDGFMGLFGVGGEPERDANAAVEASKAMLAALPKVNEELKARGEAPIAIGIGLHRGKAIIGSLGSPQRLEFTAIGNTVNLASRIEGLTKVVGTSLLISEEVFQQLEEQGQFADAGRHEVKGGAVPLQLYQLE